MNLVSSHSSWFYRLLPTILFQAEELIRSSSAHHPVLSLIPLYVFWDWTIRISYTELHPVYEPAIHLHSNLMSFPGLLAVLFPRIPSFLFATVAAKWHWKEILKKLFRSVLLLWVTVTYLVCHYISITRVFFFSSVYYFTLADTNFHLFCFCLIGQYHKILFQLFTVRFKLTTSNNFLPFTKLAASLTTPFSTPFSLVNIYEYVEEFIYEAHVPED